MVPSNYTGFHLLIKHANDAKFCENHRLFESAVQQDYEFDIGHLKRFSFRELQIATSNFSPKNILGQGGFGVVYKGYLPNRTIVAVKRLKDPNFTGEVQFQTEVEMIGLALHRNLLRLYGFCMTSDERLLVYPYMPNGSVADRLRGLFPFWCCVCLCSLLLSLSLNEFEEVGSMYPEVYM